MTIRAHPSILIAALLVCGPAPRHADAQGLSESTGVNQYFRNCAPCHEGAEAHEAPRTSVLEQMTPERIFEALTTGTMRTAAAALSDEDKRLIAEWLGGRKIDTDAIGAAEKMPNVCETHAPVRSLDAPGWNGWGVDRRKSRARTRAMSTRSTPRPARAP